MPIQKQIEGVRQHQVRSEVGVSVHWSADEAAARKAIKAAFEADEKHQWTIGDLLNRIAPSAGDGVNNPEATAKFEVIAQENDRAVASLQRYRRVAARFPEPTRMQAGFRNYEAFSNAFGDEAAAELAAYMQQGGKLIHREVEEYLAELTGKGQTAEKTTRELLESIRDKIWKRFPPKLEEFRLTDEEYLELTVLRGAIDNVIHSRVSA